jgi:PAS domain S-box-containing protein
MLMTKERSPMMHSQHGYEKINSCPLWLNFISEILCFILAAIFLGFVPVSGAQGSEEISPIHLTAHEKQWLSEHPVIRIAPDPYFPPIESIDNHGEYSGIAADFMQLVQKETGINFQVIHCKSWDEVLERARSREVDALPAAAQTLERSKYLLYTDPHMVLPGVIITRAKVQKTLTLTDLSETRVSVVKSYVWQESLETDFPDIQLDLVPDIQTGLKKVALGISDAMVATLPVAIYYIEKQGITNLRVAGETGYYTRLSFASRNDWPELNAIVQKALVQIPQRKKEEIIGKWIHLEGNSVFKTKAFWIILIGFLGVCGLTIISIAAWNRSLRSSMNQKTEQLRIELAERKRVEAALRESEEKYRLLFMNSNDVIYSIDPEFKVLAVSPAVKKLLGYAPEELIGRPFQELNLLAPESLEQAFSDTVRVLSGEYITASIYAFIAKDGTRKFGEVSGAPLFSGDKVVAVISVARDITDRVRAEAALRESENKFRSLFDVSPQAIALTEVK